LVAILLAAGHGCGNDFKPPSSSQDGGTVLGNDGGPTGSDGGPTSDDGGVFSLQGPPIDPTVPTTFSAAVGFLYSGANPPQAGVAPGAIDEQRLVVMRGRVLAHGGTAIQGARVSIVGHPEFGSTLSREDGWYDLATNGGGVVRVNIAKDGYFPAQRQAVTPWRRWEILDDAILTAIDPDLTAIDLGAPAFQTVRGKLVSDQSGQRQLVLLFAPGTVATAQLPDGGTQAVLSLHVRTAE